MRAVLAYTHIKAAHLLYTLNNKKQQASKQNAMHVLSTQPSKNKKGCVHGDPIWALHTKKCHSYYYSVRLT
jgi:hypothetical protein